MKIQLKNARKSFSINDRRVLSEDELAFITGESAILSGSGTSSTSGMTCCDALCACKAYIPFVPGSGSGSGFGSIFGSGKGSEGRKRPHKGSK